MKLKINQAFHDKDTDELYEIGKIIEVDETRGSEILSHPLSLAEQIVEEQAQEDEKPKRARAKKEAK